MRLIFVRHGEPDYANDCLTENGIIQARATAQRLKTENIKAIYSSPMGRAKQTAAFTAEEHGLEVRTLDFMHEIGWGNKRNLSKDDPDAIPFEGHPWTLGYKLLTENPEYIGSNDWAKHPYFKENICMDYFEKISAGIDELLMEYGLKRHNGYYLCEKENSDTIALFAHGGSGAIMFSHVLNLQFPIALTMLPYGVCSVSVIAMDACQGEIAIPRFELFNDMRHIEKVAAERLHFEK